MLSVDDLMNMAAETADHTETTSQGDFEYTIPPDGVTVGRFISYVELGLRPQRPYQGKAKPDAEEARFTFELLSPAKNIKEIETEGGKKKIADQISFNLPIKLGEKASFKRLFTAMLYGRQDKKHVAQMLGEAFLLHVYHNEVGEGDKKKTFANLRAKDGSWGISAPIQTDAIAGTSSPIAVPDALTARRIFLWDRPTKETWDALFIDGTRKQKNDKGEEVEVSKNWLQEMIMSAKNFKGSPLEAMLAGVDNLSIDPEPKASEPAASPAAEAAQALAAKQATDAAATKQNAASGLAELGL